MTTTSNPEEMGIAPHVSIVMAVYNGSEYLRLAMESVFSQTFERSACSWATLLSRVATPTSDVSGQLSRAGRILLHACRPSPQPPMPRLFAVLSAGVTKGPAPHSGRPSLSLRTSDRDSDYPSPIWRLHPAWVGALPTLYGQAQAVGRTHLRRRGARQGLIEIVRPDRSCRSRETLPLGSRTRAP